MLYRAKLHSLNKSLLVSSKPTDFLKNSTNNFKDFFYIILFNICILLVLNIKVYSSPNKNQTNFAGKKNFYSNFIYNNRSLNHEIGYLQPIFNLQDSIVILDISNKIGDKNHEIKFGSIFRKKFHEKFILGLYSYYDLFNRNSTSYKSAGIFGAELLSKYIDLRVNSFLAFSQKDKKNKDDLINNFYNFEIGIPILGIFNNSESYLNTKLFFSHYKIYHKSSKNISGNKFKVEHKLPRYYRNNNSYEIIFRANAKFEEDKKCSCSIGLGLKISLNDTLNEISAQNYLNNRMLDNTNIDIEFIDTIVNTPKKVSKQKDVDSIPDDPPGNGGGGDAGTHENNNSDINSNYVPQFHNKKKSDNTSNTNTTSNDSSNKKTGVLENNNENKKSEKAIKHFNKKLIKDNFKTLKDFTKISNENKKLRAIELHKKHIQVAALNILKQNNNNFKNTAKLKHKAQEHFNKKLIKDNFEILKEFTKISQETKNNQLRAIEHNKKQIQVAALNIWKQNNNNFKNTAKLNNKAQEHLNKKLIKDNFKILKDFTKISKETKNNQLRAIEHNKKQIQVAALNIWKQNNNNFKNTAKLKHKAQEHFNKKLIKDNFKTLKDFTKISNENKKLRAIEHNKKQIQVAALNIWKQNNNNFKNTAKLKHKAQEHFNKKLIKDNFKILKEFTQAASIRKQKVEDFIKRSNINRLAKAFKLFNNKGLNSEEERRKKNAFRRIAQIENTSQMTTIQHSGLININNGMYFNFFKQFWQKKDQEYKKKN